MTQLTDLLDELISTVRREDDAEASSARDRVISFFSEVTKQRDRWEVDARSAKAAWDSACQDIDDLRTRKDAVASYAGQLEADARSVVRAYNSRKDATLYMAVEGLCATLDRNPDQPDPPKCASGNGVADEAVSVNEGSNPSGSAPFVHETNSNAGFFKHDDRWWKTVPADPTEDMIEALYGPFLSSSSHVSRLMAYDDMLKIAPAGELRHQSCNDDARDAARYRWWRKWWCDGKDDMETINSLEYDCDDPATMDAAIDAQLQFVACNKQETP